MRKCSIPEIDNEENYFKKENRRKITLPQDGFSVEYEAAIII